MTPDAFGLTVPDYLELCILGLLAVGFLIWNSRVRTWFAKFAAQTRVCMILLFALPIALRLLLLPSHPKPTPDIYDEFSHLLVADTLLHLRLANPSHPLHQFFETFFVLQQPTYSSIYSLGLGATFAIGRLLTGTAWAGVLISAGLLCSLCYWMLRAWVPAQWALAGGLLAVIEFGPLNLWANCYWGGALPAAAGCLVFGALPRLTEKWSRHSAVLLVIGLGVHALTRQFESTLLLLCVLLYLALFAPKRGQLVKLIRLAPALAVAAVPFLLLILLQNKSVTHNWFELPEQLSQYQYGVPTSLTFQPVPAPHIPLTPQQALDYKAQSLGHGLHPDSLSAFLLRLEFRVRYYRFFFLPALYLVLIAFLFALRKKPLLYAAIALAIFALGTNLFPYLLPHYLSAVTCLFVLAAIVGLERLSRLRMGPEVAKIVALLCAAHFALWYGLHLFEATTVAQNLLPYETWDAINHGDPHDRKAVDQELAGIPGKLVILVQYSPHHIFQNEWVWNTADIDSQRIIWARDLGADENSQLKAFYPDRTFLLFQPDLQSPTIEPYQPHQPASTSPFQDVH